jgi:aryl-alcohol dehydrogenase-like predicted oxidoreductase
MVCLHQMTSCSSDVLTKPYDLVRLGKSGLKVSKLILGCMTYGTLGFYRYFQAYCDSLLSIIGTPKWQGWVLEEQEAFNHIKLA